MVFSEVFRNHATQTPASYEDYELSMIKLTQVVGGYNSCISLC